MKKFLLVLLIVSMFFSILTGCGQSKTGVISRPKKDMPEVSRELVVVIGGAVKAGLDPVKNGETYEALVENQIYDFLVTIDKDGKVAPSLADKYEITPDGKTYTFYLRKGIKFSNGSELKASDVKFSVDSFMKSDYFADGYVYVNNCEVVDDYTVKVNMKLPDASFLEKLASGYCSIVNENVYKKSGDQCGQTPQTTIGTGPYVLKEYKPGETCVLEANPNYFIGAPDIKKVSLKTIESSNAAVIELQTRKAGLYLEDVPGISVNAISGDSKLNLEFFPSKQYEYIVLNWKNGVFKNKKLRQAIAYAVDRQKALIVGTEGRGVIVDDIGGPGYTGKPDKNNWYKMDAEKARQIVKESGMEGKTITIKTYKVDPLPKLAKSIQDDLSQIGLNVKIQEFDTEAFIDEIENKGNFEITVSRYISLTKDMDEIMYCFAHSEGPFNDGKYSNPVLDSLITKAKQEMNPDKRKGIYAEADKIFTNDVVQIPLFYPNGSRVYSKDLVIDKGLLSNHAGYNFVDYKWKQ